MLNFRQWKKLIVAHVKLPRWDFDFYYHLLHTISVVNCKLCTTNILSSVLNSRLLKPTILKFSFIFIEFRYNLSISVPSTLCFFVRSVPQFPRKICHPSHLYLFRTCGCPGGTPTIISLPLWIVDTFSFPVSLYLQINIFPRRYKWNALKILLVEITIFWLKYLTFDLSEKND